MEPQHGVHSDSHPLLASLTKTQANPNELNARQPRLENPGAEAARHAAGIAQVPLEKNTEPKNAPARQGPIQPSGCRSLPRSWQAVGALPDTHHLAEPCPALRLSLLKCSATEWGSLGSDDV